MKKIILFLSLINFIYSQDVSEFLVKKELDDSFITKYEYGKMLYNNPRGISCAKCHGSDGKGKIITTFEHYVKKKKYNCVIKTNDITNISFEKFKAKLDPDIKIKKPDFDKTQVCEKLIYGNVMPKYFLTQDELETIYYYLTNIKEDDE